ncbi:MAG: hypothetical protein SPL13_00945 [Clostridia bacterium]|nr:hypothetical protein [Clostridia bacterium]
MPNMPNMNPVLTEQEKIQLFTEHRRYIDDFNSHFPENMKIPYDDDAFRAKLDNPEEVMRYRRSVAREEKLQEQRRIYERLESKFGTPPEGRHYLNRNIEHAFKTDGSDESNEYNENLYKDYVRNPEKLLYKKIQNIINSDPQPLYEAFDNKGALCDFYDNHQELCEDAFVFGSIVKDNAVDWVNPQFKQAMNSMKKPIEELGDAQKAAYACVGSSYLTMPELTVEQATILMGSGPQYAGKDAKLEVRNTIMRTLEKSEGVEQAKDFYDNLREHGMQLNNKFFLSHVAEQRQPDGTHKVVSFHEPLKHPNDANLNIRKRTKDEIWHIRNISKEYEREYLGIWQKKFSDLSGSQTPFNFAAIKDAHKGNIFERMLFRTSRQYTEFINAFEAYNNPESKDYLNREKLREKAEAYQARKIGQGKTLEQMDATSRKRMNLTSNVIATLDYMDKMDDIVRNQIDAKLYPEPGAKAVGEQFLQSKDVSDAPDKNGFSKQVEEVKNVLNVIGPKQNNDNVMDLPSDDDDLDMTV